MAERDYSFLDSGEDLLDLIDIGNIGASYKISMISEVDPRVIASRQLLSQVDLGTKTISGIKDIAVGQDKMSDGIAALDESATRMHNAVLKYVSENAETYKKSLELFSDLNNDSSDRIVDSLDGHFYNLINSLNDLGFELTDLINENTNEIISGFDRTTSAIHASSLLIQAEIKSIENRLSKTNETLDKIEKLIENQGSTKIKELFARTKYLVNQGLKSKGSWREKFFEDARVILQEAKKSSLGFTNPLLWYHLAFLTLEYSKKTKGDEKKKNIILARDYYENAARLFSGESDEYYIISLREAVEISIAISDYERGLNLISNLPKTKLDADFIFQIAKCSIGVGAISYCLKHLRTCFRLKPIYSILVFNEKKFAKIRSKIILLIEELSEYYKNLASNNFSKIKKDVDLGIVIGTYEINKNLISISKEISKEKDYISINLLYENLIKQYFAASGHTTDSLERVLIFNLWGRIDLADKRLYSALKKDHALIYSVFKNKNFKDNLVRLGKVQPEVVERLYGKYHDLKLNNYQYAAIYSILNMFDISIPLIKKEIENDINSLKIFQEDESFSNSMRDPEMRAVVVKHEYDIRTKLEKMLKNFKTIIEAAVLNWEEVDCRKTFSGTSFKFLKSLVEINNLNYSQMSKLLAEVNRYIPNIFFEECNVFKESSLLNVYEHAIVLGKMRNTYSSDTDYRLAIFRNILLMHKYFEKPFLEFETMVISLYEAINNYNLKKFNQDLFKIDILNTNGLGSNVSILFRKNTNESWQNVKLFIPMIVEGGFLGKKERLFKFGDVISLEYIVREMMEKHPNQKILEFIWSLRGRLFH